MIHLNNIWFIIIAIFWVGYFILEGFDFGVGMLHSFVGKSDVERRITVNSIGPIWDGNEVWLVVAAASIFAAFPSWYATMFSTFYLALTLVLLALILRGVSFEFTRKIDSPQWQSFWRWCIRTDSRNGDCTRRLPSSCRRFRSICCGCRCASRDSLSSSDSTCSSSP